MTQPAVGIRADASPAIGVGHAVRCLALAEELLDRGCAVTLIGEVSVDWLRAAVDLMDLRAVPAPVAAEDVVALCRELGLEALVVDGYELDPDLGAAARRAGMVVLALHDGGFGAAQDADVHLDQNLGSTPHPSAGAGHVALAGVEYALFRRGVLDLASAPRPDDGATRVLAVFGGTDPRGAAGIVAPLVLGTGVDLELTCIVARPELGEAVAALPTTPGQTVRVLPPTPDVMALAAASTVTVSAAGSSVWELLLLGVPTGVVAVADNQLASYHDISGRGVVAPVGALDDLVSSPRARRAATAELTRLLTDTAHRERLSAEARRLVDGQGRRRVADVLLDAVARRR